MIGYIVVGLNLAIVLGVVAHFVSKWNKEKPKYFYRGVGIKNQDNSVPLADNWRKEIEQVIEVIKLILIEKFGTMESVRITENLWIETVPHDGLIHTPTVPEGVIFGTNRKVIGSIDLQKFWALGKLYYKIVVVKRNEYQNASESAIFHEMFEHILPLRLGQDGNANHQRKDLEALTSDAQKMYSEFYGNNK